MAYLGFFLDAVYALKERISIVTKIFDLDLTKLMGKLDWYKLFIEIRNQHAHCGTSILSFGYDRELKTGFLS